MKYNLDILYECNKNADQKGCIGCGEGYCDHTVYPEYAANKHSVEIAEEFFNLFKPVYGPEDHIIGFEEVLKEE